MESPFFSVIIPAYNPGAYLAQTIQSVIDQTFTDWEILVIDDGSRPEEAEAILQTIEAARRQVAPEKIRFYRQDNQGVSVTRNFGTTEARASWLAFLDNDDLWKPTMLEKQHAVLSKKPHLAMCHTGFDIIGEHGQVTEPGYGCRTSYLQFLAGRIPTFPCNNVVSKAATLRIGGWDPLYPIAQDVDFYLKIYKVHAPDAVEYIEDELASYRLHSSNASRTYRTGHREVVHILSKHIINGQHQGRADVVAAARKGIKQLRPYFSRKGFDQSRVHLHDRNVVGFLSHLGYAFWMYPPHVFNEFKAFVKSKKKAAA